MANMNPAALFPQQGSLGGVGEGMFGIQRALEAEKQMQLQTQMARDEMARRQAADAESQQGAALREQQRQLQMQQVGGQLQRMPDVNTRLGAEAAAAAAPGRIQSDMEGMDLESQAKVRRGQISKQADEMEVFAQAFDPILKAQKEGDFTGANDAWDSFFDTMEKNKMPGVQQMRLQPRDQLLQQLAPKYQQALNTAPALRERVKLEDQQAHQKELEQMRQEGRIKALAAAAEKDEKEPNTTNAVVARLTKRLAAGETLTETQQGIIRSNVETNFARYEPDARTSLLQEARREVNEEAEKKKGWFGSDEDAEVKNAKVQKRYLEKRNAYLRRDWPTLYKEDSLDFNKLPPKR